MQVEADPVPGQQHHFRAPDDGDAAEPGPDPEPVLEPGNRQHHGDYAGALELQQVVALPVVLDDGGQFLRSPGQKLRHRFVIFLREADDFRLFLELAAVTGEIDVENVLGLGRIDAQNAENDQCIASPVTPGDGGQTLQVPVHGLFGADGGDIGQIAQRQQGRHQPIAFRPGRPGVPPRVRVVPQDQRADVLEHRQHQHRLGHGFGEAEAEIVEQCAHLLMLEAEVHLRQITNGGRFFFGDREILDV